MKKVMEKVKKKEMEKVMGKVKVMENLIQKRKKIILTKIRLKN